MTRLELCKLLLESMPLGCDDEVKIRIAVRDKEGCVKKVCDVPISYFNTFLNDYVVIAVEQSEIEKLGFKDY